MKRKFKVVVEYLWTLPETIYIEAVTEAAAVAQVQSDYFATIVSICECELDKSAVGN